MATGRPVSIADLGVEPGRRRWPRFTTAAADAGIRAVHALPLQALGQIVGALTLLHPGPHLLTAPDRRLGQALADMATLGLLHRRAARNADDELHRARAQEERARHLLAALHSRDVIGRPKAS